MSNELRMTWAAYTSKGFDSIYNSAATEMGHRPAFSVTHGGDHARVTTNPEDFAAAQAIIAAAETHVSN